MVRRDLAAARDRRSLGRTWSGRIRVGVAGEEDRSHHRVEDRNPVRSDSRTAAASEDPEEVAVVAARTFRLNSDFVAVHPAFRLAAGSESACRYYYEW